MILYYSLSGSVKKAFIIVFTLSRLKRRRKWLVILSQEWEVEEEAGDRQAWCNFMEKHC